MESIYGVTPREVRVNVEKPLFSQQLLKQIGEYQNHSINTFHLRYYGQGRLPTQYPKNLDRRTSVLGASVPSKVMSVPPKLEKHFGSGTKHQVFLALILRAVSIKGWDAGLSLPSSLTCFHKP